ncbi:MAG: Coenzyme F420 hydrogenase/dehydrogenase, beta subunit C-terminal domain [Syntrophomonas sp.]
MPGGIDLKTEVLNSSSCTLCGVCLDWCPYLKSLEHHLVMPFACKVQDGRCYSVCPRTFTDWQEIKASFMPDTPDSLEMGAFNAVYKVKSVNSLDGQQDGGTVSSLIKTALEETMVQAALLTGSDDNISPSSFLTADTADIEKAAGSRFLAAPGLRKITEAVQKGIKKMLVVGRPCQVQALRKYQKNHPADAPTEFISIGLFCMWSLSWTFKDYLQNTYPGIDIKKISIPQHGVEVLCSDGIKALSTEKVKEFVQAGCSYCLDMTSELADISVGAFEAEPGWNTVLVRTPQGAALLQRAVDKGYLKLEEYPQKDLDGLKRASLNKKARNLKLLQDAVDHGRLKPFVDLSQPQYTEILAYAEGMVKS